MNPTWYDRVGHEAGREGTTYSLDNSNDRMTAENSPVATMTEEAPAPAVETGVKAVEPAAVAAGVFDTLAPPLRRAVDEAGYERPTPIQTRAIPPVLAGRDVLGCAQTGTGKTAAFILPILQRLSGRSERPGRGRPRALILAPTRELAAQIGASIRTYGAHVNVSHTVIFGGVGQGNQVQALQRGVDIVVATPGRLLDLVNQRHIQFDAVEVFVLDEADRMLDMGFIPDIRRIVARLPANRQTLFFSATLDGPILPLARTMVRDAVQVSITPGKPAVERITQKVHFVEKSNKDALLASMLDTAGVERAIVFTRTKHGANKVVKKLMAAGHAAEAIHGNKSQNARTQTLQGFKAGRLRVLVATDIAARGIDVDGITHVINFDLPNEPETYVHRIGRTARAGADGAAVSFCSPDERAYLRDIERLISRSIPVDAQHDFHSERASQSSGTAAHRPSSGGRSSRPSSRPSLPPSGHVRSFGWKKRFRR